MSKESGWPLESWVREVGEGKRGCIKTGYGCSLYIVKYLSYIGGDCLVVGAESGLHVDVESGRHRVLSVMSLVDDESCRH